MRQVHFTFEYQHEHLLLFYLFMQRPLHLSLFTVRIARCVLTKTANAAAIDPRPTAHNGAVIDCKSGGSDSPSATAIGSASLEPLKHPARPAEFQQRPLLKWRGGVAIDDAIRLGLGQGCNNSASGDVECVVLKKKIGTGFKL